MVLTITQSNRSITRPTLVTSKYNQVLASADTVFPTEVFHDTVSAKSTWTCRNVLANDHSQILMLLNQNKCWELLACQTQKNIKAACALSVHSLNSQDEGMAGNWCHYNTLISCLAASIDEGEFDDLFRFDSFWWFFRKRRSLGHIS